MSVKTDNTQTLVNALEEIERLRETMSRVADEIDQYRPEADEYQGKYVHKWWAKRLRQQANELEKDHDPT